MYYAEEKIKVSQRHRQSTLGKNPQKTALENDGRVGEKTTASPTRLELILAIKKHALPEHMAKIIQYNDEALKALLYHYELMEAVAEEELQYCRFCGAAPCRCEPDFSGATEGER